MKHPRAKEILATVGRAYASLDPKLVADFKARMNSSGLGDDPAVIEVVHGLAQRANANSAPAPINAAKALFPNLK
jgi:hypothetical protein